MNACPSCGSAYEPSHPEQKICDACDALAHPVAPSAALRRVGSYTLAHELGAGRYATSWLAESSSGGGVILKLLRAHAPDAASSQRFLDEARRLGSTRLLEHPALARVLDAGVHEGGALFLVYESGGETTLADELRGRGRIVAQRAIELCAQICDGVHALHQAGFSHFDLKPANVGVTRDEQGREQAVLLDAVTGHLLTRAGLRETATLPISTAAYLAPELANGRPADERADLYSTAVMLYQLLCGRLPITGYRAAELIESHRSQRPLRLRDVGRRVHGDLEAIIQRALSKDPHARFADGAAMAAALRQVAPVAEQATEDVAEDDIEDPLQVTVAQQPEPEVAPPPRLRPLDAPAERPLDPDARPGPARALTPAPAKKSRVTPLRVGLLAVAVLALGAIAMALRPEPDRPRKKRAPAPIAAEDARAPAEVARESPPPPSPEAAPAQPASAEAAQAGSAAAANEPAAADSPANPPPGSSAPADPNPATGRRTSPAGAAPKRIASSSSVAASMFSQAQRQLAGSAAKPAMRTLFALLDRTDLSGAERARATRMMAEAETEAGNKPAAIDWYRKYLQATDDPGERARVVQQIRALNQ